MSKAARPLAALACLALCACAGVPRDSFSKSDTALAQVPGYSGIRTWGDGTPADFRRSGFTLPATADHTLRYLAISGGGSVGAFGAGLLVGLSKAGARPQFDMVSGVSTGALIAPFAYLGAGYDGQLTQVFTSGIAKDVATLKWLPAGLLGVSLLEPAPLRKIVNTYVDMAMLGAVAREHRKGRRLLVITTNMDAERAVVWDMGKIAASGQANALGLFRDVLVASASVPGAFPPVLLNVAVQEKSFAEMHADGGATVQVFTVPEGILSRASSPQIGGRSRSELYVLINNTLRPDFQIVKNDTLDVAARGVSSLVKAQTRSSLEATYAFTKRVGMGFHLAAMDHAIDHDAADPFNTGYMQALYRQGFDAAQAGRAWISALPAGDPAVSESSLRRGGE